MMLFLTTGIGRWLVLSVILMALFGWFCEHLIGIGEARVQVKFDAYVADVKAKGLQAELDNRTKERDYAKQIADANAGRDSARDELRRYTAAHPVSRASPNNPAAPSGSAEVCFDSPAYTAAFRQFGAAIDRFIQDARGLVTVGDEAQIDAVTLLKAWPTDKRVSLESLIQAHYQW